MLLHLMQVLFGVIGWVSVQHFEISACTKGYINTFDLILSGKAFPREELQLCLVEVELEVVGRHLS